jgi:hypothetical protein
MSELRSLDVMSTPLYASPRNFFRRTTSQRYAIHCTLVQGEKRSHRWSAPGARCQHASAASRIRTYVRVCTRAAPVRAWGSETPPAAMLGAALQCAQRPCRAGQHLRIVIRVCQLEEPLRALVEPAAGHLARWRGEPRQCEVDQLHRNAAALHCKGLAAELECLLALRCRVQQQVAPVQVPMLEAQARLRDRKRRSGL